MISLLNNVQSDQEPKAGVKNTTRRYHYSGLPDVPSSRMIWPNLGWMQITSAPIVQATRRFRCRLLCRFSDAGNRGSIHTRGRPASEKRQGRKSRSVVQRRCGVRYGDLAAGLELMRLDRSRCGGWFAVNRGWLHRGEGAIGTLHDGICGANTGQCRGRMRACLRPAASQRGWQVSELLSIGGDGITRCRS
jgi:hypothetical protein